MTDIDRLVVDYIKTFEKPAIFLSIEPKMVRANKEDSNSPMVQGRDSNGGLKWIATVAVPVKAFDREKFVNLSITLTSPTQPCTNLQPGHQCVPEMLVQGLMPGNKNPQFWSADSIRPVTAQAGARVPSGERIAAGQ